MPQTVFVIMGEWEGRYMRMDDAVATEAVADGWAYEHEIEMNEEVILEEAPDSLIEFDNPPVPGDEAFEATSAETGKKPIRRKKAPTKSSKKHSR